MTERQTFTITVKTMAHGNGGDRKDGDYWRRADRVNAIVQQAILDAAESIWGASSGERYDTCISQCGELPEGQECFYHGFKDPVFPDVIITAKRGREILEDWSK